MDFSFQIYKQTSDISNIFKNSFTCNFAKSTVFIRSLAPFRSKKRKKLNFNLERSQQSFDGIRWGV